MNDIERFNAIVHFEKPDQYPIFGFPGAPGFSAVYMKPILKKLADEGMPDWVGGTGDLSGYTGVESWHHYWGTTGPIGVDFFPAEPSGKSIKCEKRIEGGYEILEYETGELTRQVINNDDIYSMPEFIRYPVRDRASWEFYRDRITPGKPWPREKIKAACEKYKNRTQPLAIGIYGSWGTTIRNMMGTVNGSTILYDDYELASDIIEYGRWMNREYYFPIIEELKPEIVYTGEDICYKGGMLISPEIFMKLCAPLYEECMQVVRECGVSMFAVDTDGNAMEFAPLVYKLGVNGLFPFEVKSGNDLFELREQCPRLVMFGWLEKEIVNEDNGHLIHDEIMSKVPRMLERGGYFPNADHGIQPFVTFENLCKCMTLLHKVTNNPEGKFPRIEI